MYVLYTDILCFRTPSSCNSNDLICHMFVDAYAHIINDLICHMFVDAYAHVHMFVDAYAHVITAATVNTLSIIARWNVGCQLRSVMTGENNSDRFMWSFVAFGRRLLIAGTLMLKT